MSVIRIRVIRVLRVFCPSFGTSLGSVEHATADDAGLRTLPGQIRQDIARYPNDPNDPNVHPATVCAETPAGPWRKIAPYGTQRSDGIDKGDHLT